MRSSIGRAVRDSSRFVEPGTRREHGNTEDGDLEMQNRQLKIIMITGFRQLENQKSWS